MAKEKICEFCSRRPATKTWLLYFDMCEKCYEDFTRREEEKRATRRSRPRK